MSIHEKVFNIEDKVYFFNNLIIRCDKLMRRFGYQTGCLGKSYCNTIMKQIINGLKTADSMKMMDSGLVETNILPQCGGPDNV